MKPMKKSTYTGSQSRPIDHGFPLTGVYICIGWMGYLYIVSSVCHANQNELYKSNLSNYNAINYMIAGLSSSLN